jgi:hypothetical protein
VRTVPRARRDFFARRIDRRDAQDIELPVIELRAAQRDDASTKVP